MTRGAVLYDSAGHITHDIECWRLSTAAELPMLADETHGLTVQTYQILKPSSTALAGHQVCQSSGKAWT